VQYVFKVVASALVPPATTVDNGDMLSVLLSAHALQHKAMDLQNNLSGSKLTSDVVIQNMFLAILSRTVILEGQLDCLSQQ
jgi:hypothetical protein